jgi:hypothetical protein
MVKILASSKSLRQAWKADIYKGAHSQFISIFLKVNMMVIPMGWGWMAYDGSDLQQGVLGKPIPIHG